MRHINFVSNKPKSVSQITAIRTDLADLPFGSTIRQFMDYMTIEAGLSENTILAYGRDLREFAKFCFVEKIKTLNNITALTIQNYMKSMAKNSKAEASISRSLVAIKMLLRYAMMMGFVAEDFTKILEGPKLWQKLPVVCSKNQVIDLLQAPQPEDRYCLRDRALLELLYATGMRAAEVAGLKIKDLNMNIGYLRCIGKGKKERIIPLSKIAITAIEKYLTDLRPHLEKPHSGNFLLLSRTGRPLDRIEIWRLVKKYATRCGMPPAMTVHTLRHCFASHLLAGGADLRSVQEMLGHVNIATTQIYTHIDQDRLRNIHKKFHPMG